MSATNAQADLQDWINKNLSSEKLNTQNLVWDKKLNIIKIDGFKNSDKAHFAYNAIMNSAIFSKMVSSASAQLVEINSQNLKFLFAAKDLQSYINFYQTNLVN